MSHDTIYLLLFINLIFIVSSVYILLTTINNLKITQGGIKTRLWELYANNHELKEKHKRLFKKTIPSIAQGNVLKTLVTDLQDRDKVLSDRINMLEKKTFGLILKHKDEGVFIGNRTCDRAEDRLKSIEYSIKSVNRWIDNQTELSFRNAEQKEIGKITIFPAD